MYIRKYVLKLKTPFFNLYSLFRRLNYKIYNKQKVHVFSVCIKKKTKFYQYIYFVCLIWVNSTKTSNHMM